MSELEQIRRALGDPKPPTQAEFGKLLGAGGQSTYHRWENEPDSGAGLEALARAKAFYREIKGKAWAPPVVGVGASKTGDDLAEASGRLYTIKPRPLADCIPEAWAIIHEVARAGGADLMAMDVKGVGEILAVVAEVIAAGRGEEARQRGIQRAGNLLRVMARPAP